MWPWQLKRWPKRYFFLLRLFIACTILHLLVFLGISFVQMCTLCPYQLTINANALNNNVQVVFLPLYKKISKEKAVFMKVDTKKLSQKKEETGKVLAKKNPEIIQEKVKPKAIVKNNKTTINKENVIRKKPVKEILIKKETVERSKGKTENKKQKITDKNSSVAYNGVKTTKKNVGIISQRVYAGRQELALLQMQARIQKEVSMIWKPPVGLPKNLLCQVTLTINDKGHVTETKVSKSSGVLLYDVSARTALTQLTLPLWAHGKKFCITFKQ
ncbi:TonB C-terminal domain-containing protein [Candidatus Dependentiae bacterium]|nr:TonB C-terminal domain-containing protein [Candidatus Dependentiae bacterium]